MGKDVIDSAQEFFEFVIKIFGENMLYRTIYGELPTDTITSEGIRESMGKYDRAEPLLKDLANMFEAQASMDSKMETPKPIKKETR